MSEDLEDILEAAGAEGRRPRLVQVGRAVRGRGRGGRPPTTGYFWSSGRVSATVGPGWARIRRRYGNVGDEETSNDLRLDVPELRALDRVCRDWARRRTAWAAFYHSSAGRPAGFGGGCYYQAPGRNGEHVTIGTFGIGGRRGGDLRGRDGIVSLGAPRRLRSGLEIIAEIWRRGERFGPKTGSLVGVRYRIGPQTFVDARRLEARVWRKDREVFLEEDEGEFVSALLSVVPKGVRRRNDP